MDEGRRASRFKASFPVEIESRGGVLVDMSSSGIAFETDQEYEVGDRIDLKVRLGRGGAGRTMELECTGEVVRIEHRDGATLVAATVEWKDDDSGRNTLI